MCSLVILFLFGHVVSTGLLAWQFCHHTFLECPRAESTFFIISGSVLAPVQFCLLLMMSGQFLNSDTFVYCKIASL